jgi:hypothetical protein
MVFAHNVTILSTKMGCFCGWEGVFGRFIHKNGVFLWMDFVIPGACLSSFQGSSRESPTAHKQTSPAKGPGWRKK